MSNLMFRTRGMVNPKGKPRVYFTCHPNDFERTFKKVCDDILGISDCAIYYTENMSEVISDKDRNADFELMNLFVIPVTKDLLQQSCRAMATDFVFAKKANIPVLPIMFDYGFDYLYSQKDKFGEMQYINPFSSDNTEISYEEKLKKYLTSVLISDEMAKKVRAEFDAYIFLSYRKKDRRYANELMRLIHAKPEFRDIAIWYDEFLTPGESFNENIGKMLNESELFALLVTPNLLEEPDGKPNFVMGNEYPAAKEKGMDILPAEMESTDKNALQFKFADIPEIVNPHDDEAFKKRLLRSITRIATSENDDNPEHNFLIGLAYLDGIDVEVDRQRGLSLIKSAARDGLLEAANESLKRAVILSDFGSDDFDEMESLYLCAINGLEANKDNMSIESSFNLMVALYKLAGIYRLKIRFLEANECYLKSTRLANEINNRVFDTDKEVIAHLYFDYGTFSVAYSENNNFDVSIEFLNKALGLFCDISLYKPQFKQYVEEIESVLKTIEQELNSAGNSSTREQLEENDSDKIAALFQFQHFYGKGDAFEREKSFDKAVMNYQSALKQMETLKKMGGPSERLAIADIYDRIALCYEMLEQYSEAKYHYEQAMLLATTEAKEAEDVRVYDSAINYAWKIASFCEEFGDKEEAKKHYEFRTFLMEEKTKLQEPSVDEDFLSPELKAELSKALEELDFTPSTFKEGEEIDYSKELLSEGESNLSMLFDTLFGTLDDMNDENNNEDSSIITLTDQDGNDTRFEFVDLIKFQGNEYIVLVPCEDGEEGVVILMVESDDEDTESYLPVEDEALLSILFEMFKERNKDKFNFTD